MKLNISSRGLLVEDDKVLFIEYTIDGETYYALPGGTLEVGENLHDCVVREFDEETGIAIQVDSYILLNEFINPSPKAVAESWKNGIHQIETIFSVSRKDNQTLQSNNRQFDFGMQGTKWLSAKELEEVIYYPEMGIDWFFSDKKDEQTNYKTRKH